MAIIKNNFTTLLFLCVTVLLSCSKSDDGPNNTTSNMFSVKIDGANFQPDFVSGFIVSSGNNILVSANKNNGEEITLIFPITAKAGDTFSVENLEVVTGYDSVSPEETFTGRTGSMTITSHNTNTREIAGTFSFNAESLDNAGSFLNFTEGSFKVVYEDL